MVGGDAPEREGGSGILEAMPPGRWERLEGRVGEGGEKSRAEPSAYPKVGSDAAIGGREGLGCFSREGDVGGAAARGAGGLAPRRAFSASFNASAAARLCIA